ncbi:ribosomal protection-like ABC-F family protein [Haloimpatiens sp. FM7330]|uniref:ribosomal protection-like ABC-F family protein n=1 Tax=Haloimpatiens sp. FM7330 TaxID=3298610 RepID=UPI0036360C47
MIINVENLTKYIKEKQILKDISFRMYKGDKIGVVGDNGVGKTTLFKTIVGKIEADDGKVKFYDTFGYLPQELIFDQDTGVSDFMKSTDYYEKFFEMLSKFNLRNIENRKISTLSGGEKTKLYLAKILIEDPKLLILDEPTNHLDYDSIIWLEKFIKDFKGAVLVITHDRYFLDNTVSKIFELKDKKLKEYSGNYSFYAEQKKLEYEKNMIEYGEYVKEKRKLEIAARKHMERSNRYNNMSQNDFKRHKAAKIAKRSKAIITRLEKLDKKDKPSKKKKINMKFDKSSDKTSEILIRVENLCKSFDKILFQNINFNICKGKKIAVLGKNGVGKSTLLKAIIGQENVEGNIYSSPSANIGYFSQELRNLNFENTILDEIKIINEDQSYIRTLLGCMMFRREDVYKKIGNLSLGEMARVSFLKLILQNHNVLILDEPTNFLDISSREVIEEALLDYRGAILFVSHDRYFIKKMADEIWEMSNNGLCKYLGGYNYYLNKKQKPSKMKKVNIEEQILNLEMTLAQLSFKLLNCKKNEKETIEKEYFDICEKIKKLKKLQNNTR